MNKIKTQIRNISATTKLMKISSEVIAKLRDFLNKKENSISKISLITKELEITKISSCVEYIKMTEIPSPF